MLPEVEIVDYWRRRAEMQRERTVGYANQSMGEQDTLYQQRRSFIFKFCPMDRPTLDYGCGIGRYADCFQYYTGTDITEELLSIARKNHPQNKFVQQKSAIPDLSGMDFSLFFTATVLQHCADAVVSKIFSVLRDYKPYGLTIFLYENSDERVSASHVCGRSMNFYLDLLASSFSIKKSVQDSHLIHGEKHGILLVDA